MRSTTNLLGLVLLSATVVFHSNAELRSNKTKRRTINVDSGGPWRGDGGGYGGGPWRGSTGGYGGGANGHGANEVDFISIARGAAFQATSAYSSQESASRSAVYRATSSLAQTAAANAATAQTARVGKQAIVSALQRQMQQAHEQVGAERWQLNQAQVAAQFAQQVARKANKQVAVLRLALHDALSNADNSRQAADAAARETASQAAMLSQAQQRLWQISKQLNTAQAQLEATHQAAQKASSAAHAAQNNAYQHGGQRPR